MQEPCPSATLVALMFVALSGLTQDQRQVLTSLTACKNRMRQDYRVDELRNVCLEVFCAAKTTVDNPLLAPSGSSERKSFLALDEGTLEHNHGHWHEDEEDGAEGFLDAFEDCFWMRCNESCAWFQRRFRGAKVASQKRRRQGQKSKRTRRRQSSLLQEKEGPPMSPKSRTRKTGRRTVSGANVAMKHGLGLSQIGKRRVKTLGPQKEQEKARAKGQEHVIERQGQG